ncbi:TonB-dependent receptor plug domain-containing protein [Maribellus sp. YY47]|uniref:TonB-dependent receptor n=1 Tax=Maribellus sp. YY47 TaxID=2929486 RepID=UPI002001BB33|nr:TonB-dependent receptor plug domain-containing protein [Maribellus sp. YY47]MCK3683016.1 TonB-dependent receptor [Maribellus sp. YY47]
MVKLSCLGMLLLLVFQLTAQTPEKIKVTARKTPLNQVLLDLKENYGFQFAFDADLLSNYPVSANREFKSAEETLRFLIKNLPLELEKSDDVFLILPRQAPTKTAETQISGQVLESLTSEPLPFSYVSVNRTPVQTDQNGNFNFIASTDSTFALRISHLGYFVYDTIVTNSLNRKFFLMPRIESIQEVRVSGNPIEKSTLIGDKAGYMKINLQIAPILPGHGDNSVFNLLRLMPGVLAAGEQSNNLLIWGAYEGQSKIQFDGFTVFGLKNFNDNISVVNPFMVKNIEVMKGGYEARYGDRVGGIVDIAAKDGSMFKPGIILNINSNTVNTMVQAPIGERSSVIAAYRQTYYPLYDPSSLSLFSRRNNAAPGGGLGQNTTSTLVDFNVQPDYVFRDANLKFSHRFMDDGLFSLSFYGGGDDFSYDMEGEIVRNIITQSEGEKNQQYGGSAQFSYPWANGNVTNVTAAYSYFQHEFAEKNELFNTRTEISRITREVDSENKVDELSLNAEHTFSFNDGHKLVSAVGLISNGVQLQRTTLETNTIDFDRSLSRIVGYVQDEFPLNSILKINAGLRANYVTNLSKLYIDPRFSTSLNITKDVKFNASWGIYHQFLVKTTVVDSLNNFTNFWMNADEQNIPVLNAMHTVAGWSYNHQGWTASLEGYYKTTGGLTRYYAQNVRFDAGFFEGKARTYGLDLFLKKEYKRHVAWISYSYCQADEHFSFYLRDYYRPAPQQQKHEIKFAGILNYKSFYFSTSYVYGSGFERFDIETASGKKLDQPYNRLDASLVYKFKPGKVKAEAGISILNVLNTENIKYSNLRLSSTDDLDLIGVYADAVSFTPAIFLKLEF